MGGVVTSPNNNLPPTAHEKVSIEVAATHRCLLDKCAAAGFCEGDGIGSALVFLSSRLLSLTVIACRSCCYFANKRSDGHLAPERGWLLWLGLDTGSLYSLSLSPPHTLFLSLSLIVYYSTFLSQFSESCLKIKRAAAR